jgi:hypothetical protein
MSWGATSFTPIISYNEPPFGFAERPQQSDYPTCVENPYNAAAKFKERIKKLWKKIEKNNTNCDTEGFTGSLKDVISPYSNGEMHYGVLAIWFIIMYFLWTKLIAQN